MSSSVIMWRRGNSNKKILFAVVDNWRGMVDKGILFLQDNAPAHKSQNCNKKNSLFVARTSLATSDYYLFLKWDLSVPFGHLC